MAADGYTPSTPANCGNQTKDVQELATGYWYDFYRGPMGRFRQGIQYSYFQRNIWSGAGGTTNPGGSAKGTDNAFWTSIRYYLPRKLRRSMNSKGTRMRVPLLFRAPGHQRDVRVIPLFSSRAVL